MPELDNQTPYSAEMVPMIDKDGRNIMVVIAKGTFTLDKGAKLTPAAEQDPVVFVDDMLGDPGSGPIRVPSDLVDYKPATDLVIVRPEPGPESPPLDGHNVFVEVGPIRISGRCEENWKFGPLRRDQEPRKRFAGTYDKSWVENRMPLLPEDFDPRCNHVAPPGQIAPGYLLGDEPVRIKGLHSREQNIECELPGRTVIVAGNVLSRYFTEVAVLDTILIWPGPLKIGLVWRHRIYPRQKIEEICNVYVYSTRLRTARELYGRP